MELAVLILAIVIVAEIKQGGTTTQKPPAPSPSDVANAYATVMADIPGGLGLTPQEIYQSDVQTVNDTLAADLPYPFF